MEAENQPGQILTLLQKHLLVQEGEPLYPHQPDNVKELKAYLTSQIAWMLDHAFERLLQAMYRIDVAEQKFKAALTGPDPVAAALADLVLEREIKKIEIRRKFSPLVNKS